MSDLLTALKSKKAELQRQVERIDSLIAEFSDKASKRHLSRKARNRIGKAQKKRWAAWKAQKDKAQKEAKAGQ